jgi:hypothetical protein
VKLRDEVTVFELAMFWFSWIEVRDNYVTAGQFSWPHESSGEEVTFFNFGTIEENKE